MKKSFLQTVKSKWVMLVGCLVALILALTSITLMLTVFNVNTDGQVLTFTSEEGINENLEAIGSTYDDSGVYVTSFYDTTEGSSTKRHYTLRKLGKNNEVIFEQELTQAPGDNGEFNVFTGITEDLVLAYTYSYFYLYKVQEDGLLFLDAYQTTHNVQKFSYYVHEDASRVDIYNLRSIGSDGGGVVKVAIEKVSIDAANDVFYEKSTDGDIPTNGFLKKKLGKKNMTDVGNSGVGVSVSADGSKLMILFKSALVYCVSSDMEFLNFMDTPDNFESKVQTLSLGEGCMVTFAEDNKGVGEMFVGMTTPDGRVVKRMTFDAFNEEVEGGVTDVVYTDEEGDYSTLETGTGILYFVNQDGNTVYAVDIERDELAFKTGLEFKIECMVASPNANQFVCKWTNSVTDAHVFTSYELDGIALVGSIDTWRTVMIVVAAVCGVLFLLFGIALLSDAFAAKLKEKGAWFFGNIWKSKWIYLLILPSFALLVMFSLYPSAASIINSFFEYELGKPKVFIGFENYRELFVENSALLLEIVRNSLLMVGTYLFTMIVPPVLYAYLIILLRNKKSVKIIRLLLYIPGTLPSIAVMLMWRYGIYGINPNGALNTIIELFGGTAIPFLGHSDYAIWSILLIGFPWVGGFLLFYGALMGVPSEVYDACELDGCGIVRRFFAIDLPYITGQIKYVSIGAIISGVKAVGRVMATTNGTMGTMTLMYKLYDYLRGNRYGMASAVAVIMVLVLGGLSLMRVRKMLKKEMNYD